MEYVWLVEHGKNYRFITGIFTSPEKAAEAIKAVFSSDNGYVVTWEEIERRTDKQAILTGYFSRVAGDSYPSSGPKVWSMERRELNKIGG